MSDLSIYDVVDDLDIDYAGGACPFQAEGTINGHAFYYRERGGRATLSLSADATPTYVGGEWAAGMNVPEFRSTGEDASGPWLDTFINLLDTLIPDELGRYAFTYFEPTSNYTTFTCWMDERVKAFFDAHDKAVVSGDGARIKASEDDMRRLEPFFDKITKQKNIWAESVEDAKAKVREVNLSLTQFGFPESYLRAKHALELAHMDSEPTVVVEPRIGQVGPAPITLHIPDEWRREDTVSTAAGYESMGAIWTPWRETDEKILREWDYDAHTTRHSMINKKIKSIKENIKIDNDLYGTSWSRISQAEDPFGVKELVEYVKTLSRKSRTHKKISNEQFAEHQLVLETLAHVLLEDRGEGKWYPQDFEAIESMMLLCGDAKNR